MPDKVKQLFADLLSLSGEDVTRDGLQKTPERAAQAFRSLTQGYDLDIHQVVNGALFSSDNKEMVVVKNIELFSLCEHHMLPIMGKCHIGYMPNGKVIGLSKIARIVDAYARRLQMQENLTKQIAEGIIEVTGATGAGVIIEAEHLCIMARGVEKQHAKVKTSAMLGSFKNNLEIRNEFLNGLNEQKQSSN
jgi:GTP cyclohydrolase I